MKQRFQTLARFGGLEQALTWGVGFTLYKTGMIFILVITMTTT